MRRSNISAGATNPDINEVAFDALPEASITLAPHAKISLATYVLTAQGLGMLRAGTLSTGIFGEAEYFDVFGKWHRTKFCYRLMGRTSDINDDGIGFASNIGAAWAFIPDRIETTRNELTFRLCKRNNCADEQCGEKPDRPFNDHPNLTLIKEYPPSLNPNGNKLLDVESRK
jgi:hypothetical protein